MSHLKRPFNSLCFCTRAAMVAVGCVAFLKSLRVYLKHGSSSKRPRGLLRQNFPARGSPLVNGVALAGDSPFSISWTLAEVAYASNCAGVYPIFVLCVVVTSNCDVIHGSFPPSAAFARPSSHALPLHMLPRGPASLPWGVPGWPCKTAPI